jgi:hypothetical protein
MTPAMIAAMKDGRIPKTAFYEIGLPDATRYMLLGSGEVQWGGHTYKGRDPTFGVIDAMEDLSESTEGVAPNSSFTIRPDASANRAVIAAPNVQLSPVKISLAAVTLDGSNHVVAVADPEELFNGFIDQATTNESKDQDEIDYTTISAFDFVFEASEGQRLNGAFHQMVWTGEKGLDNVTGVTKHIYWGALAPTGVAGSGGSSIYGGGASNSGGGTLADRFNVQSF